METAVTATDAPTELPTEAPTEEPTEVPTEAPTEEPTEEPTEPPVTAHSGIREDGSFNEGALFIGDSLTYGLVENFLMPNELLGDARYMAMGGAALSAFYFGPQLGRSEDFPSIQSEEFRNLLMCEALEVAGESVRAIYFMMGTNYVKSVTTEMYIETVELMLEKCPNATVYMQLVPFDDSPRVDSERANEMIKEAYAFFAEQEEPRVFLIDSQSAIGYNLAGDGIHLTTEGQACWYQALVAFADGNHIPE